MSEQKADGYVVKWEGHLQTGFFAETLEQLEEFLDNYIRPECGQFKLTDKGWTVHAVRLQFPDEPQGEGWIGVNERLPEDSDLALDVTFYSPNYLSNGGYWVEEDVYFANGNWCKYVGAGQYLDPYKPIQMNLHEQKVVAWKKHVTPKPYIPTEQKEKNE